MSVGEVAGLLAAVALVALVAFLAVPILKLGKTFDELAKTVRDVRNEHVAKTAVTVDETNELLATTNAQLQRVDAITANAKSVSDNAAAMTSLFSATLGSPLVRTAAFTYGVRQAINARRDGAEGTRRRRRGRGKGE
jgi:uncharacterized protein YoxC